jgi:cation diffusion facilitator CzcD-associated flavoprotein CzcO
VDGVDHGVDVLVLATGYKSQAYMRPIDIRGVDGVRIADVWDKNPYAYRSFAVPGFPNMFLTYGPLAPRLHVGVHETVELFTEQLVEFVLTLERLDVAGMSPSEAATRDWVTRTREEASATFLASCTSWYQGSDGVPLVYTAPRPEWRRTVRELQLSDWDRRPRLTEHDEA